jgi:branched-chain amino acid transport system substrate-binding protein
MTRTSIDRRTLLRGSAVTGAALAAGVAMPAIAQTKPIKLGYVSPQTGPLAAFAEADNFIIASFKDATKGGIKVGSTTAPVEVVVKDSQSNPNRAAQVAKDLIVQDKDDLMLVASTPETTNPVSTQCEIEEVPCISTVAPWQPWFIGRQANPGGGPPAWKDFNYTDHFFWGLEDVIAVFTNMWSQLPTTKSVGGLFPNDGDGNAWGDKQVGFPPVLEKLGYKLTDRGAIRISPTTSRPDATPTISQPRSGGRRIIRSNRRSPARAQRISRPPTRPRPRNNGRSR